MRHARAAGLLRTLSAHLEAPRAPPRLGWGGPALLGANVAHHVLDAGRAVSPALTCVMLLTVAFFGTYLAVVVARVGRVLAGRTRDGAARTTAPEALLAKAVGALPLAPMLAVLLVCARLRELRDGAIRQPWLQLSLCVSTGALLLRIGVAVVAAAAADAAVARHGQQDAAVSRYLSAAGAVVSLLLYGSCAVIVVNVFTPLGSEWSSSILGASDAALRCGGVIVVAHLGEQLVLELLGEEGGPKSSQVAQAQPKRPLSSYMLWMSDNRDRLQSELGTTNIGTVGKEAYRQWREIGDEVKKQYDERSAELQREYEVELAYSKIVETMSLQLPLMLCVLFAGIQMRAMQLAVVPAPWARAAMYTTTCAVVIQTIYAGSAAVARRRTAPRLEALAPATDHAASEAAGAPAEGDHAPIAPERTPERGAAGACLAVGWGLVVACLYVGTGAILASVFMMEAEPLDAVLPASMVRLSYTQGLIASTSPPVSPALQCVVVLTAVSFATYLCLLVGFLLRAGKWASVVVDAVGRALAFVPMLCVMMIALRLRAMHLGLPDPQPWAQTTMRVATASVVVQVGCSLFMCVADGEALDAAATDEGDSETSGALVKVVAIALTVLRYLASFVLYVSVAVLIAALVAM